MSRYVLAISGGIDSVVLLDMFKWSKDTIVAHFNHGIRESADDDCIFVEKLAAKYGLQFVSAKLPLGENCSEETARRARYDFLKRVAKEHGAEIVTAHHADDCVESIMINLLRGTGWRGIAPFGDKGIFRPMLNLTKADIYRYASEQQLHFRQDQSNNDDTYLRNRVRQKLSKELDDEIRQKVLQLYRRQVEIREDVDKIIADLAGVEPAISRDLLDETSAPENIELLRGFLKMHDCAITRPQAERCLREIKNFTNGKKYSIDKTHFLVVGKHNYRLQFD